jgi:glutamine synthetase
MQHSALDAAAPVLQEMCEMIHALGKGLRVEQMHKESAPGQFEIVLGHLPALEAADGLLLAKQAIVAVAQRHGLRASFLPKLAAEQAGSGCHVHLSVWRSCPDNTLLSTCHLPPRELEGGLAELVQRHGAGLLTHAHFRRFVGGVVAHLPSLMCFTTPTPNSFRRLQPSAWAGCHAIWGFGNKEAPVCVPLVAPSKGLFSNFEFKLCDGTANPHVALAALLAAGMVGIDCGIEPPPPTQVDPGASPPGVAAPRRLPQTFAEAKAHLVAAERSPLRAMLGEDFVQCHLAVREAEWAKLGPQSLEEEARLLFDRY